MEEINLIYTTDLHGFLVDDMYFQGGKPRYGLFHIASILRKMKAAENKECIFFDNGDLFAGSLLSLRFASDRRLRNPVISLMNELGCKFSVLGNHEFDFGREYLSKVMKQSKFPWLSANVVKKNGTEMTGHSHYIHTTREGRKLAFIGLTVSETNELINKDDKKGIDFLEEEEVLSEQISRVKELGTDFIAVVYHGGYDSGLNYWLGAKDTRQLSAKIPEMFPEIDLFITGHTHGCIANKAINGVHTIQAGCNGQFLGKIKIKFNKTNTKISSKVIKVNEEELLPEIPKKYSSYLDSTERWLDTIVANSSNSYAPNCKQELFLKPSRISSLIHKSIKAQSGVNISVAHLWGTEGWKKGLVARRALINLMPDNDLYVLSMFGEDIKLALERSAECFSFDGRKQTCISTKFYEYDIWSGINYKIDIAREIGQRVVKIEVNDKELELNRRYSVAVFSFRASGSFGYDMFNKYRPIWKSKNTIRDYFFANLRVNSRLKVRLEKNFSVVKDKKLVEKAKFKGKSNE